MTANPLSFPDSGPFELASVRAPACLVNAPGLAADGDGLVLADIAIEEGRIARVTPAAGDARAGLGGRMVLPGFVDCHTHIDKGHIWPRKRNPDGTRMAAIEAVTADREANWSARDVERRMDFSLRCAYAHGTVAVRTHLDSAPPQDAISWPVFTEMRDRWRGRIALQAVCLVMSDRAADTGFFAGLADSVAAAGGVLGAVTLPHPDLDSHLDAIFRAAMDRGLDLDFHVDETGDRDVRTLENIADAARRNGFEGQVQCGHCCSLALQPPDVADRIIGKLAEAGIAIVSLPMCNMYLQNRNPAGTTPRWRGVTLLHELAAAGVRVSVASDNTRDPFYAYGDLDMLEVFREATRIAHLDHPNGDWARAVTATPAAVMKLDHPAMLAEGAPADLVLFQGRSWTELFARPESARTVLRQGKAIATDLPDYAELDDLMEAPAP